MPSSLKFEELPIELQWREEQQRRRREAIADWLTAVFCLTCAATVTVPAINGVADRLLSLPVSPSAAAKSEARTANPTGTYTFPLPGRRGQKPGSIPGDCRPLGRCDRLHAGADYGAPVGHPVVAAKSGQIIELKPDAGVGGIIGIKTDDGELHRYVHLSRQSVRKWRVGQRVAQGDVIATIGYEGPAWGSGPHLHFERYVDGKLDWQVHRWLEGAR